MKNDLYTMLYVIWRKKDQWVDIVLNLLKWYWSAKDEQRQKDFMSEKEKRCAGGLVVKRTIESIESKETKSITALFGLCNLLLHSKSFLLLWLAIECDGQLYTIDHCVNNRG